MSDTTSILGLTARDRVTGFMGVITGTAHYISGCSQVLVCPPVKDGKYEEGRWFDEQRLVFETNDRIVLENGATPGPDLEAPKR